ncbi:MAG: exo-alpha-sialidase [Gemmatimonadota bacterium]
MRRHLLIAAIVAATVIAFGAVRLPRAESANAPDIESLPSPVGPGGAEPFLVTGANGRVSMSWLEPAPDSAFALKVASFDGMRWSAANAVRTGRDFFVNWADFPSLEAFGANGLVAHWLQRNGTDKYAYHVRMAVSRDGGATWGTPITPHTDQSSTEHGFVAMWPEGDGVGAAWLDGRRYDKSKPNPPNEMSVASTLISAAGARGAESMLDTRACDCCQVAGAMTSDGPVIAYRDRTMDEIRDIAVVRRVRGAWTQPKLVNEDGWHIAACPVNGPAISADGKNVALAWFTAARDTARVNIAFSSDAGATFSSPVRVDQGKPAGRVDAAILADGSAIVSWVERVGGDTAAVQVRRVTPQGRAGEPVTIAASSAARASGFPRLTLSGDRVYFAWTQPTRPSTVRVARVALSAIR